MAVHPDPSADSQTDEHFVRRLQEEFEYLRAQLPEMDPDELLNILHCILRPFGSGKRFFLRNNPGGGGYVF
jgi:hypothetical protein